MSKTNLSATQTAALAEIIARWDDMSAKELARWGKTFVPGGSFIDAVQYRNATLHVLREKGMITIRTAVHTAERLRRGAYGKWIGGTRLYSETALNVCPTDAGRKFIAEVSK